MKLYHGTSYENFKAIREHGFKAERTVWNCTTGSETYFWSPDRLVECGECEDIEDAEQRAIQNAFESAQITAALLGSSDDRIVVIEYEESDTDSVHEDYSCENMGDRGACYVVGAEQRKITGYYTSEYYPDLRIFYLSHLHENPYLLFHILPEPTQKAIELITKIEDNPIFYMILDSISPSDFNAIEWS